MSLRLQALFALVLLGAIGPACAAPVLPLPPPLEALVEGPPDADGFVTVSGQVSPGNYALVQNNRTLDGVLVFADETTGAFTLRIQAISGDFLTARQLLSDLSRGSMVLDLEPVP